MRLDVPVPETLPFEDGRRVVPNKGRPPQEQHFVFEGATGLPETTKGTGPGDGEGNTGDSDDHFMPMYAVDASGGISVWGDLPKRIILNLAGGSMRERGGEGERRVKALEEDMVRRMLEVRKVIQHAGTYAP